MTQLATNGPYFGFAALMPYFLRKWMRRGRLGRSKRRYREVLENFSKDGGDDPGDCFVKLRHKFANYCNRLDFFRALTGSDSALLLRLRSSFLGADRVDPGWGGVGCVSPCRLLGTSGCFLCAHFLSGRFWYRAGRTGCGGDTGPSHRWMFLIG